MIDSARMFSNASEVRECMIASTTDYGKETYAQMVRDAITQKMDWHENGAFNGGRSANERYMKEVFETDKGIQARNRNPLRRLVGERFGIADAVAAATQESTHKLRNRWVNGMLIAGACIAAIGTAGYMYVKRDKKQQGINKIA